MIGFLVVVLLISWIIYAVSEFFQKPKWEAEKQRKKEEYLRRISRLSSVHACSPEEFEHIIAALFEKQGYAVRVTQYGRDGGIDLYLHRNGIKEIAQCKRYAGNVSVEVVRAFYGVLVSESATRGYVVTTGSFTLPAKRFAEGKPIHLIDGVELADLMISVFPEEND